MVTAEILLCDIVNPSIPSIHPFIPSSRVLLVLGPLGSVFPVRASLFPSLSRAGPRTAAWPQRSWQMLSEAEMSSFFSQRARMN